MSSPESTYFAYGSNLCLKRLRKRVPGVHLLGRAHLPGYRLAWHKRSNVDGSGKCSIAVSEEDSDVVYGALFHVPAHEWAGLDRAEGVGNGYDRVRLEVRTDAGARPCFTYIAQPSHIDESLEPVSWYRDLVVAGAEALKLPEAYVEALRSVPATEDPDRARDVRERTAIPCMPQETGQFIDGS